MLQKITQNNPAIALFEMKECDNSHDVEASNLTAHLNEGWQMLEIINFLARGSNHEGSGYLVKLYHPAQQLSKELTAKRNREIESLFARQAVPGYSI